MERCEKPGRMLPRTLHVVSCVMFYGVMCHGVISCVMYYGYVLWCKMYTRCVMACCFIVLSVIVLRVMM